MHKTSEGAEVAFCSPHPELYAKWKALYTCLHDSCNEICIAVAYMHQDW